MTTPQWWQDVHVDLDLALTNGRVIDPETGHDAVADVGISDGRIVALGTDLPAAVEAIDCSGLVVCPGFVDLHSHAQSLSGARLQAFDGVTTALDLECGALPVRTWHETTNAVGHPLNYGYSASWALARAQVRHCLPSPSATTPFGAFQALSDDAAWQQPLTAEDQDAVCELLAEELAAGAIGIGMMLGYHPRAALSEIEAVSAVAARHHSAVFVHSRSSARNGPVTALDAVEELVAVARTTGAHLHLCHVNSTSSSWLPQILAAIDAARAHGVQISTEAYPYSRGSTVVGAAFLAPEELASEGHLPDSLTYLATGEAIADATRLEELRRTDPAGLVLTTSYDLADPDEAALFDQALLVPHAAFASDAMPIEHPESDTEWPLPGTARAHPRSAGCFTRVLAQLVRERGLVSLPDAIRRCTLVPAEILREAAPGMRRKGRIGLGADADVVVFDADHISDQADYTRLRPALGVRQLLIGGVPVIKDGRLLADSRPGRPVTGHTAPTEFPRHSLRRQRCVSA